MAMNLNSVLRITAEVTGLKSITALEGGIEGAEKAARSAEKGFKAMLDSRLFRTAAVAAAAIGTAIGLSTKAAIDFESSMADVRKVVDGLESPEAFKAISNEILELSSRMPIAAKGFAEIYAAAGQAGVAREDLKAFATQVAQVAVAFDMTAEEAGTSMAKIQTSLGLTLPQLGDLTDAMNHLSNNTASSAADLVDFTLRAGQAGKSAGLTAEQTAAFGAAMVAAGSTSEVAATSFRNMVKALSRGPSMTERQIGALNRLGFAQSTAVTNEQQYTEEVKRQSEQRIEAARNETNQLAKELNRRFRDQMRSIQDNFDDESEAYQEAIQDRTDEQIKGLQRQQQREMDAARQRAEATGTFADNEIYAIQDLFDRRIDAVRDAMGDELKARRRGDRDRLQAIQDDMDDRKEAELAGLESNFSELQNREKALMNSRVAEIKAQAQAGATAAAEALAKGLQQDAIGTITDVFNRIKQLPEEAQLSVISDLFGDEARAILPLVNNTALLEKAMGLVGDKTEYAGSTLQEYLVRSATTANQMKLAQNNLNNLAITFGQQFAPALGTVMQAFAPLIQGFAHLLQTVPGLAPVIAVLAAAFVGLVAVLPAIASLITILGAVGGFAGIFATIAGWLGVIGPVLGSVVGLLGGFGATIAGWAGAVIPVLTSIAAFIGPQGLIALAVIGLGALFYAFRDQIFAVFQAIGDTFMMAAQWYKSTFIDPVVALGQMLFNSFQSTFQRIGDAIKAPIQAAFGFLKQIVNSYLQGVATAVNGVVNAINRIIRVANAALGKLKLPQIGFLPNVQIPAFAEGGIVNGPTVALVGEAGPEYIVPAHKAQAFSQNYLAGVRGPAAIPRFAEGGFVAPGNANVNIQTGPVTQMNGQNFVTTQDMTAAVRAGVQQTLDLIRRDGSVRTQLGLA